METISDCKFFLTMPAKRSPSARESPRADAQRNRERIPEVAKEAFARSGANASLDDIANAQALGLE
jgi:hypothetical protein